MTATAARLLWPLDRARLSLYRVVGRILGARMRPLIRDRELRVGAYGLAILFTAGLLTLVVPLWLLALGPVIWGIPHVLSDVRYLVVRQAYHRRPALWLAGGLPIAWAGVGGGLLAGLVGCAAVLAVARTSHLRRALGLAAIAPLAWLVSQHRALADLVFAHAHNLLAVGLWLAWRPPCGRARLGLLAAFLSMYVALLLAPALAGSLLSGAGPAGLLGTPAGLDAAFHARVLAPGATPGLALGLVLAFAFAQSVHYGVWLRLVPEEDRARETPRSFAASYRALVADVGSPILALTLLGSLAVLALSLFDLEGARDGYLRMALFHGHLELVAATMLWAESRRA